MPKIRLFIAVSFIFLIACQKEGYITEFTPAIVVDGSIENDNFPRVFLTRNIPTYIRIDSADFGKLVLRQAKITVSDGEQSEILTLKYDKGLFPPFYYEGNELQGKAGKTYFLTIVYGNDTLTSSTTIPNPVKPDSVWFRIKPDSPDEGLIMVKLKDDPDTTNYYKMFTRIQGKQTDYYPTLNSVFSDRWINGQTTVLELNKGPETYLDMYNESFYFSKNDTIWLKVCTLDKPGFDFWNSYRDEVANGSNPIASSYHTIPSNIKGKGLGIWGGFGTCIFRVIAR
jgi:hypothetical protein